MSLICELYLGLVTSTVSSELFQAAQPALLYLVPFTLLPLLLMAYLKVPTTLCLSLSLSVCLSDSMCLSVCLSVYCILYHLRFYHYFLWLTSRYLPPHCPSVRPSVYLSWVLYMCKSVTCGQAWHKHIIKSTLFTVTNKADRKNSKQNAQF